MISREGNDKVCPIRVVLDRSKRLSDGVQEFCDVRLQTCKS